MIVEKDKLKISVIDVLVTGMTLLYSVGIRLWYPVCPVMGENIMACHWAGEILKGLSFFLVGLSLCHLLITDEGMKKGIAVSMIFFTVFLALVPGGMIRICMMADMHCHVTRLITLLYAAVSSVLLIADVYYLHARQVNNRHHRSFSEDVS